MVLWIIAFEEAGGLKRGNVGQLVHVRLYILCPSCSVPPPARVAATGFLCLDRLALWCPLVVREASLMAPRKRSLNWLNWKRQPVRGLH